MKNRGIVIGTLVVFLVAGLLGASAEAEEIAHKLTRGAINTATGWTELPLQVAHQVSEDPYRGMTYGFMDGLSMGLKRTLYGVTDFVTFPVPPYDKPVMDPETVFGEAP